MRIMFFTSTKLCIELITSVDCLCCWAMTSTISGNGINGSSLCEVMRRVDARSEVNVLK